MNEEPTTRRRKRPTGRRQGDSGTREAILDAALSLFAADGYEATSMRAIAGQAGVDPGLVRYFFDGKETLFATAVAQRTAIPDRIVQALEGDPPGRGRRVTDAYLRLWDGDDAGPVLLALLRAAMTTPRAAELFIETLGASVGQSAPSPTPGDPRAEGFALAATHLLGLATARHVLRLPVIVGMSHEQLVDRVAPVIQNYLVGNAD